MGKSQKRVNKKGHHKPKVILKWEFYIYKVISDNSQPVDSLSRDIQPINNKVLFYRLNQNIFNAYL